MSTVVILGAGVDATLGIPTSNALIPKINEFLATEEGKAIDEALRSTIKGVRFHFDKFVSDAIERLAKGLDRQIDDICVNVSDELAHNQQLDVPQRKMGELIVKLFRKIQQIKLGATIDDEIEDLIQEVFGTQINDDSIIDFSKLSYTETFKSVIICILNRSINDSENPVLRHVYKNILDIEQLLVQYFYGFYTGQSGYIKNYMYIAWIMWAFLVNEEKRITQHYQEEDQYLSLPVYSQLSDKKWDVVSFNYTSFAQQFVPNSFYFHGSVSHYVDVKNNNDIKLASIYNIDIIDFIRNNLENQISFDSEHLCYLIPTFLPPLQLKPVLSRKYIEVWYKTWEVISAADKIIVLGYSCSLHDEHFNSIVKENRLAEIIVVDKNIDVVATNLCSILGLDIRRFTTLMIQGKNAKKYDNRITLIESDINEIMLDTL